MAIRDSGKDDRVGWRTMSTAVTSSLGDALQEARERTLTLVAPFSHDELERVQHPLMSPLCWDLGHIAAYEDLWLVHRHGGEELLRGDLADLYDAFETPRAVRGDIPFLRGREVFDYIAAVRRRSLQVLDRVGPGDGTLFEMVIRHEAQHNETMRQTLFLGGLPGGRPPRQADRDAAHDWIEVPAGRFEMGAPAGGFAFDNERPRHAVELPAFMIARRPVTNGSWMHFCEGGGYERREWWSDEGWAWKEEYDITHPEGWTADGPTDDDHRPVLHVSWFEADAFARAHGARLPTEAEWETAATWTQEPLEQVGEAWEWTRSHFRGYPGFVARPYREYSEVFFGDGYRVLRGASWATESRVRSTTFRNWDLPQRRQIFAGVRLAKDVT
jgi:iron(II)-dependent oxidoreductase